LSFPVYLTLLAQSMNVIHGCNMSLIRKMQKTEKKDAKMTTSQLHITYYIKTLKHCKKQ